jgi:hypothetical protein
MGGLSASRGGECSRSGGGGCGCRLRISRQLEVALWGLRVTLGLVLCAVDASRDASQRDGSDRLLRNWPG